MVVRPKEDADGFFWGLDSSFVAASTINYLSRNIALLQNSNNILHKYLEFNKQSIIFSFQKVSDRMEFILKRTIHSVDSNEALYPQTSLTPFPKFVRPFLHHCYGPQHEKYEKNYENEFLSF